MKKIMLVALVLSLYAGNIQGVYAEEASGSYEVVTESDIMDIEKNEEMITFEIGENAFIEMDKNFCDSSMQFSTSAEPEISLSSTIKLPYPKTITISKSSPNWSKSVVYEEYNTSFGGWYKGTLYFKNAVASGGKYIATYAGIMAFNPNR